MSQVKASVLLLSEKKLDVVQIAIRRTGICGSDQHYYKHMENAGNIVKEDLTLGHESSGEIVTTGSNVSEDAFKNGDLVAIEVGVPCDNENNENCKYCSDGHYNLCPGMKFRSSAKSYPHYQGTLQERINHPAKWVYKIPPGVTLEEGALVEPLSVAVHAVNRAGWKVTGKERLGDDDEGSGANVLVIGAGAIGLLTAAVMRVKKAAHITITDLDQRRVDFATDNGFADVGIKAEPQQRRNNDDDDKTPVSKKKDPAEETADILLVPLLKDEKQSMYDVVFECTGEESCVQTAIFAAAPGGVVMLVGMGKNVLTLPLAKAAHREVDIRGVFRYAGTYQPSIDLISQKEKNGLPDISKLVTHHFKGVEKVEEAFKLAGKPVDDNNDLVLKVMIDFEGEKPTPVGA